MNNNIALKKVANKINNSIQDLSVMLKKHNLELFLSEQNPAKELKQIIEQTLVERTTLNLSI